MLTEIAARKENLCLLVFNYEPGKMSVNKINLTSQKNRYL